MEIVQHGQRYGKAMQRVMVEFRFSQGIAKTQFSQIYHLAPPRCEEALEFQSNPESQQVTIDFYSPNASWKY